MLCKSFNNQNVEKYYYVYKCLQLFVVSVDADVNFISHHHYLRVYTEVGLLKQRKKKFL